MFLGYLATSDSNVIYNLKQNSRRVPTSPRNRGWRRHQASIGSLRDGTFEMAEQINYVSDGLTADAISICLPITLTVSF